MLTVHLIPILSSFLIMSLTSYSFLFPLHFILLIFLFYSPHFTFYSSLPLLPLYSTLFYPSPFFSLRTPHYSTHFHFRFLRTPHYFSHLSYFSLIPNYYSASLFLPPSPNPFHRALYVSEPWRLRAFIEVYLSL